MSIITLKHESWIFSCDLAGGRIIGLSYENTPILGSFRRRDGKQGSTHLCIPNFAAEGMNMYGLPFHGPARTMKWTMEKQSDSQLSISVILPQTSQYKAELKITQTFKLGKTGFIHIIRVEHIQGDPVALNVGIHNYWATLTGWNALYINHQAVSEQVRHNLSIPLKQDNLIEITGKKIRWETKGFGDAVLWAASQGEHYDSHYVCIEPVMSYVSSPFLTNKKNLHQKNEITLSQKILLMGL